jgi:hypothetical protein
MFLTRYNALKILSAQRCASIIHGRATSINEEHAQ